MIQIFNIVLNLILISIIHVKPSWSESTASLARSDKVVVAYYAPWDGGDIDKLPYRKLTHINYSFGTMSKKDDPASIVFDQFYDAPKMKQILELGHRNGVKVLLAVGGWTGSQTFSIMVKDTKLRKKFIDQAIMFMKDPSVRNSKSASNSTGWGFDGIDIDWEYPGRQGASCSEVDKSDSRNYLTLLKELRTRINSEFPQRNKLITAAVRVEPFDDRDGRPMKDISEYMKYLDYISLMAYDLMGPWSETTGVNAPLDYDPKSDTPFSLNQAIASWMKAGAPRNKIVAGTAFYGRSVIARENMLDNRSNMYQEKESKTPKGDPSDSSGPDPMCPEAVSYSGIHKYKYLRRDILVKDPKTPADGWERVWDSKTKTPWLFNRKTKKFISYDDPESIRKKVEAVKQKDLKGVMVWSISMDYKDELVNVLNEVHDS